jgi:hypothetical protein
MLRPLRNFVYQRILDAAAHRWTLRVVRAFTAARSRALSRDRARPEE